MKLHAVKFADGTDDTIEGWGAPYGGPFNGKDLDGERFSKSTDFALDWFPTDRPLLYDHGLDTGTEIAPVGRVKAWDLKDDGLWVQAQLDKSSGYFDAIQKLVKQGKLYFSSGAMAHLVQKSKSGEILRWPWVELSLTPTPANLLATLSMADAEKHYKSAGLELAVKAAELKARSYEDVRCDIEQALNPRDPFGGYADYTYVCATYPDAVVVNRCDYDGDGDGGYYRIPYSVSDDGSITLGPPVEVEQSYVPVPDSRRPVMADALFATRTAAALSDRVKALSERRAKSGRALSRANRAALEHSIEALDAAAKSLHAHLVSEPEVKADGARRDNTDFELLKLWAAVSISGD